MLRGHYTFKCPHCGESARYWYDPARGYTGDRCVICKKRFEIITNLEAYKPDDFKGEKSPLWNEAVRLLSWVPEFVKPSDYDEAISGLSPDESGGRPPFVSEGFLYHCLGKEDARTFLALMRKLLEAGGIDMYEVEQE